MRVHRITFLVVAPFVLGASIACAPSTDSRPTSAVTDSAGIRIVTTSTSEWADTLRLELPEAVLTLPGLNETTPLSSVVAAEELSDGRIAVLDGQSEELIVFGSEGAHLFTFGRQGEGPGEFLQAVSIQELSDGTVAVFDASLQRLTRIDREGMLAGVQVLPDDTGGRPTQAWLLNDGSSLAWTTAPSGPDPERTTSAAHVFNFSGALVRILPTGGTVDTLFLGPSSTSIRQVEERLVWNHPFGARSTVAVDQAQSRVLLSTGELHEIDVIPLGDTPTSSTSFRVRFPTADRPITSNELAVQREEARSRLASEGVAAATGVDFLFDRSFQPELRPAFHKLVSGPHGSIWAQRFEPSNDDAHLWWVISDAGVFRGLVELPARSEILSFSDDHMLLLRLDDFDVPSIDLIPLPVLDNL